MAADAPSVLTGALKRPFAEQVAFFRGKLGRLVPTERWDDMTGAAHDTGFMVAGAQQADLLQDLAAACDRMAGEGKSLDAFRRDFKSICAARGWTGWTGEGTPAGEAWRTRIICWGNCATSYNAGRLAQLREGEFEQWIYIHSDLVETPRPEHLAWHGVTLPPGHPFWKQHYTPCGWGCECTVRGARSLASAKRLGGEPAKPLPRGWDAVNPSTGTQVGVDKGWGYMPGDSVSDTVRTLAAKAQAWDYDLAKAYMQQVPPAQRDAFARAYRDLPSVATDTRLYAQRILEDRTNLEIPPYRTLGLLTADDAAQIEALTGRAVADWDYAIDAAGVRAAGLEPADYARLPGLLNRPDAIEDGGTSTRGHPRVRITGRPGGDALGVLWEVRADARTLTADGLAGAA